MNTFDTQYNPHAEAETYRGRRDYHTEQAAKMGRQADASARAARVMMDAATQTELQALAASLTNMVAYHNREASKAAEDLRDALARCNDLDAHNAAALRAAADTADMQGYTALAIELNRRAARVDGYDPDSDPGDDAWDNPEPDERATD